MDWKTRPKDFDLKQGRKTIKNGELELNTQTLINDYWTTAKGECNTASLHCKGGELKNQVRSWNSLDYDQQQKLIRYWGYEKAWVENNYLTEAERLERQSQEYLKEIELAKFHEERGKIKCECWQCEERREIQQEVKTQREKELYQQEKGKERSNLTLQSKGREQCSECGKWVKKVDEENGVCKRCLEQYNG
ncbi:MAG: hypothetical protein MRERC_2c086 [Mycoplasmataceae bacterium RC_NB112A]|nr:MAG: hypothetical protein MRERC_2c086 [Mycoplasmataceae bacterium RC_NB112A]